jgi:hypothetical protein
VAERSAIDERRGLVIAQIAALEDLIDEFLLYLDDPDDVESYQRNLDSQSIGPRLDQLVSKLRHADLFDQQAQQRMDEVRGIVRRRNELAPERSIGDRYVSSRSRSSVASRLKWNG